MTGSLPQRRFFGWRACAALACVLLAAASPLEAQDDEATRVVILCTACHRDKFEALASSPHAALTTGAWRERAGTPACVGCHGDVTAHIAGGGGPRNVFAFRAEPARAKADRCLECHRDDHPRFEASPHAAAGLACTDCHSQHGAPSRAAFLLKTSETAPLDVESLDSTSSVCFDCHGEIFAQFGLNEHHRLHEGVLTCTSCHDPHVPQTRRLLGGFKQQQCVGCHADKGGPFVFEHPASRAEGCTACHSPHGAPNRHLLGHERVGELCLSCHAEIPQFHLGFSPAGAPRFDLNTQCTNCHTAIHGSNFSPFLLQ